MRAVSRYKQVRITLTETPERGDPSKVSIGVRVMVKPLNDAWTMRHTIMATQLHSQPPLGTLDAVYECILEHLASSGFPESHSD